MSVAATMPAPSAPTLTFSTGYYRLVGALYTDSGSDFVQFHQDGDTYYLANSVADVPVGVGGTPCDTGTFGTTAVLCTLSVPIGTQVEAFGRITGGGSVKNFILTSPDQTDQAPATFPTAPGYTGSTTNTPAVSFPFRVWTDSSGRVRMRASMLSTTINEVTDGWVFHRAQ